MRILWLILCVAPGVGTAAEADIWEAALKGDQGRVQALLKEGVDVNARNRYEATALLYACEKKHWDLARFLLDQGADPNIEDNFYHMSVMQQIWMSRDESLVVLLFEKGYNDVYYALEVALRMNNVVVMEAVIKHLDIPKKAHDLAMGMAAESPELSAVLKRARVVPDPPPLALEAAVLKSYCGSYRIPGTKRELELTYENGVFKALKEGKDAYTLQAFKPRMFWAAEDPQVIVDIQGRTGGVEFILFHKGSDTLRFTPIPSEFKDAPESVVVEKHGDVSFKNWPGFRGTHAWGVADGEKIPSTWNIKDGTNIRWKTEIPGLGHASPVVWEDQVFIATAVSGEGNQYLGTGLTGSLDMVKDFSEHEWKIMSLNVKDGSKRWEKSVGMAKPLYGRHFKSTHANSTPVTDGENLIVVFPTAGMFCFGLDGSQRWKVDLGGLDTGWFYDASYQWGFASSPILYKDLVILQVDIQQDPYIAAWNIHTGELAWKTSRGEEIPTWSTPGVYTFGKRDELVVNGTVIKGYNPDTGKELWRLGPNAEVIIAAPLFSKDLIYVTAGYPPARPIYAVKPGSNGDLSLEPGQKSSQSIAWSYDKGGAYMPTPMLYRGNFYIGHHDGRLAAYNAKTGARVYRARMGRGAYTGSPVASDGKMFFTNEDGAVYVVEAGPKFKQLAVNEMEEVLMATPAIARQTLLIRTRTHLYAVGSP